jgi:hypothetical protein
MTKKARFIKNLNALSESQKDKAIAFFTKYPDYESRIDWNSASLTYGDFEKVFPLAGNSSRGRKRKAKTSPGLLFENRNCEIIKQTEDYLAVAALDWECAVFFNSFDCGGEGGHWCVGEANNPEYWNNCLADRNIFVLLFFVRPHPVLKRKILIQYDARKKEHIVWLQDNTAIEDLSGLDGELLKTIRNKAEALLSRVRGKDYLLDGPVLRYCGKAAVPPLLGITEIGPNAFQGSAISEIELPETLNAIGEDAFSGCTSLAALTLPAGLTSIGEWVFSGCSSLKEAYLSRKTHVSESAFDDTPVQLFYRD